MHLLMILIALGLAGSLRLGWSEPTGSWLERWQRALLFFLLPPLLLLMTGLAVVWMGPQGQMVWPGEGWFSYGLALVLLAWAGTLYLKLAWQGWLSLQRVQTYAQVDLDGKPGRVLDTTALFSAQIGFWQPELVVSRGLLQTLDQAHLDAVFAHEQGHYYYRDTFWFFWLGWVRAFTAWLPYTEALWQELLVLRELRADRWAVQQVDSLLLAESLLLVVRTPLVQSEIFGAAFSCAAPRSRLEERIEALIAPELPTQRPSLWFWAWILLIFLPLISVPFHT